MSTHTDIHHDFDYQHQSVTDANNHENNATISGSRTETETPRVRTGIETETETFPSLDHQDIPPPSYDQVQRINAIEINVYVLDGTFTHFFSNFVLMSMFYLVVFVISGPIYLDSTVEYKAIFTIVYFYIIGYILSGSWRKTVTSQYGGFAASAYSFLLYVIIYEIKYLCIPFILRIVLTFVIFYQIFIFIVSLYGVILTVNNWTQLSMEKRCAIFDYPICSIVFNYGGKRDRENNKIDREPPTYEQVQNIVSIEAGEHVNVKKRKKLGRDAEFFFKSWILYLFFSIPGFGTLGPFSSALFINVYKDLLVLIFFYILGYVLIFSRSKNASHRYGGIFGFNCSYGLFTLSTITHLIHCYNNYYNYCYFWLLLSFISIHCFCIIYSFTAFIRAK